MIIIQNREMLIPANEQYLGTTYDTATEVRQFKIKRIQPGIDISGLQFNLDMKYPDGQTNTLILEKDVKDNAIILTWTITEDQLDQQGTLTVQIRAFDAYLTSRWSSFKAPFYVEGHYNVPHTWDGDLTELEQLEAQVSGVLLSEAGRVAAEANRVTAEEARAAAEEDREDAETARETAFDDAIADFNADRAELTEMRDEAVQAAADAEAAQAICETYADIIIPVFYVDYTDGNVHYNDSASFTFTINQSTGNMDYVYSTV